MIVLVTGAGGFIGSHLVDAYLKAGAHVIGVDNFLTGSVANLEAAKANGLFSFVRAEVAAEWPLVDRFVGGLGVRPERVLHLASPASPEDYAKLPLETLAANSRGTESALDAALRWRARFLLASTSETYGDPLEHPQVETYWGNVNPVGPRSCYMSSSGSERRSSRRTSARERPTRASFASSTRMAHACAATTACRCGLRRPSSRWVTADHLRRWSADALFLLRVRFSSLRKKARAGDRFYGHFELS